MAGAQHGDRIALVRGAGEHLEHLAPRRRLHAVEPADLGEQALQCVTAPNRVGLADVELAVGDKFKAAELAERAVALSPNSAEVCRDVAHLFFRMERYTKANAYFMKASSLDPNSSEPLVYLGGIACERRMYKDGIAFYDRALQGDLEAFSKKEIEARKKKCR